MAGVEQYRDEFMRIFEKAKQRIGDEIRTWNRVFQFVLDDGTKFYIEISGGEAKVVEGEHPSPVATLQTDRETLEKILRGEMDAMAAFMRGKLRITGNVIETVKLRKILEAAREG